MTVTITRVSNIRVSCCIYVVALLGRKAFNLTCVVVVINMTVVVAAGVVVSCMHRDRRHNDRRGCRDLLYMTLCANFLAAVIVVDAVVTAATTTVVVVTPNTIGNAVIT